MIKKMIKIYTSTNCVYCKKIKKFLNDKKIVYEEKDITSNSKLQKELIEKTGQYSVPVTDINGEYVFGYDIEKLEKILKL